MPKKGYKQTINHRTKGKRGPKSKPMLCGIYMLRSYLFPDKFYIGSSENIRQRITNHISKLKYNKSEHKSLQNHFNKYGEDDLQSFILKLCKSDNLIEWEQFYISELSPYFNEFKFASFPQIGNKSPFLSACDDIINENKGKQIQSLDDGCYEYKGILTIKEKDILSLCDRDLIPDVLYLN